MEPFAKGHASFTHVDEICEGLKRRGWAVNLFAPSYGSRPPGAMRRIWGMSLVQLRFIVGKRPELLYLRMHFAAVVSVMWARLWGIPTVVEVNGPFEDLFIAWPSTRRLAALFCALMRFELRVASGVIAVTDQLGTYVAKVADRNDSVTIPNAANIDVFRPSAKTSIALPDRYVVFFGTLAPWQGIATVLEATHLDEWPEGVACVVAGDGQLRGEVERAAAKENGSVLYLGKISAQELAGIVVHAQAGLVVCENVQGRAQTGLFPLKLFETMACGVPVIVSDFPGMADLVRNTGCGLIIEEKAPNQIAASVARLNGNPKYAKEMGKAGLAAIQNEHSWEHRAEETSQMLCKILSCEQA
jgi:glycosyltransferase involved in cell wall biosynthesis